MTGQQTKRLRNSGIRNDVVLETAIEVRSLAEAPFYFFEMCLSLVQREQHFVSLIGWIATTVERFFVKELVVGSNPTPASHSIGPSKSYDTQDSS